MNTLIEPSPSAKLDEFMLRQAQGHVQDAVKEKSHQTLYMHL